MNALQDLLREFQFLDARRREGQLDEAGQARHDELHAWLTANFPDGIPVWEDAPEAPSFFEAPDDELPFVDSDEVMEEETEAPAPAADAWDAALSTWEADADAFHEDGSGAAPLALEAPGGFAVSPPAAEALELDTQVGGAFEVSERPADFLEMAAAANPTAAAEAPPAPPIADALPDPVDLEALFSDEPAPAEAPAAAPAPAFSQGLDPFADPASLFDASAPAEAEETFGAGEALEAALRETDFAAEAARLEREAADPGPEETDDAPFLRESEPLAHEFPVDVEDVPVESEELDLGSEELDLESEELDLGSEELDLESEELDLGSEELDLGSEELDLESEELDLESDDLDLGSEDLDLGSDDLDLGSEDLDLESEELDLGSEAPDLESDDLDLGSEDLDVESGELDLETEDLDLEDGTPDLEAFGTALDGLDLPGEPLEAPAPPLETPAAAHAPLPAWTPPPPPPARAIGRIKPVPAAFPPFEPEPGPAPFTAAAAASDFVAGERRVIVHLVQGPPRRGRLVDPDLEAPTLDLKPMVGDGAPAVLATAAVKAVFFLLEPGEPVPRPSGRKVAVWFGPGRDLRGHLEPAAEGAPGFFLTPDDAARTHVGRVFVYHHGGKPRDIE